MCFTFSLKLMDQLHFTIFRNLKYFQNIECFLVFIAIKQILILEYSSHLKNTKFHFFSCKLNYQPLIFINNSQYGSLLQLYFVNYLALFMFCISRY